MGYSLALSPRILHFKMLAGKLTVDSLLVLDSRFEILRFSFCLSFLRLARNIFAKDKGFLGVFILSKPPLRLNYKFGRGFDMLNLRIRLVAIFFGENLRWWKMKINTLISWNFPRRSWLFAAKKPYPKLWNQHHPHHPMNPSPWPQGRYTLISLGCVFQPFLL